MKNLSPVYTTESIAPVGATDDSLAAQAPSQGVKNLSPQNTPENTAPVGAADDSLAAQAPGQGVKNLSPLYTTENTTPVGAADDSLAAQASVQGAGQSIRGVGEAGASRAVRSQAGAWERGEGAWERGDAFRGDSLALSVAFMLALTVVQRSVGFVRNLLFCRFLSDGDLGRWSLAFSFMLLAAPLMVLGLPGSFGRYVEYYRSRGQLGGFLKKTTLASVLLASLGIVIVLSWRGEFARLVFSDGGRISLVVVCAFTLVSVLAFNFLSELVTALRQVRAASWMQFTQSMVFAGVGLALAAATGWGAAGVVAGYGAGCVAASLLAVGVVRRKWSELNVAAEPLPSHDLWRKIAPFAAWVWVINLLSNLFAAADRYMIVHFGSADASVSQAMVGQYHSSLVAPQMLTALACLVGGVLLPYLSCDWEAGRRRAVSMQLNLALKLISLTFVGASAVLLLLAPWLFEEVLGGKYQDGLAVLPWTLMYCVWFSLTAVAQNYLWCAEKAWLGSLALAGGLAVNIVLNMTLLPLFGLQGAVWATAAANVTALTLTLVLSIRQGMAIDYGTISLTALPLVLCLGGGGAFLAVVFVIAGAWRGTLLFTDDEKEQFVDKATRVLRAVTIKA